ncbi:RNase P/MRP, p29 subunit [Guyanagaster necrorhizus]|uniref:Ribonuclease P protein subunit n=1 Tax=Guyanagaster necrorhizus TaxID=856835 RepID=A0A9P7VWF3_9AGAR|nr:RNase P/MRP, p29 subunit [Guyanagaster necrorhizus MCA 3950]KAG7447955.1 RNase P/MRP, p29 subunit [Guyanagaster necrorhizus MCA 3950]
MAELSKRTIDLYKDIASSTKNNRLKLSSTSPFTPRFITSSVSQSSDPAEIYATRVHGRKMVLENPVKESREKKERLERKAKHKAHKARKRLGVVGKREAREKAVWKLDEHQARFNIFLPLHHLWMGYMSELLGLNQRSTSTGIPTIKDMPSTGSMHAKLLKADLHGSLISVRRCKNPCLLTLSGIVIHESENAFKIITKEDRVKLVPKANAVFAFAVPLFSTLPSNYDSSTSLPVPLAEESKDTVLDRPHIEFELYGNQFRFRSADRAGRKFKHKETMEL